MCRTKQALKDAVGAWNDAHCTTTLRVARALRLELNRSDEDTSSILVAAHRRVASALLTSRAKSHLAMGDMWPATLDAEAGVDCAPEVAVAHLRLGEVYEAAGGSMEQALRAFERASALDPTNQSISRRLEQARNAPATPAVFLRGSGGGTGVEGGGGMTHSGASGAANSSSGSGSGGGWGGVFDMSLDQMDKEWTATGLQHIRNKEWHELRRTACPHGVLLAVTDCSEKNIAIAEVEAAGRSLSQDDITTEEYIEKELFAERAMSLYAKKRGEGVPMPEGSTWLDLAFEAVNIDSSSPLEQAKICLCMGNVFAWVADFSGADELYTYALELDDVAPGGSLKEWRPTFLANRTLCRMRMGKFSAAAVDAEAMLKEAGPRWGLGLARMGQVMCALGEWDKAEQTFNIAQNKCQEKLGLKSKISLARTAGRGHAAAAAAGATAVAAVAAAKELEAISDQMERMDSVVQLGAIQPGEHIDPIMSPTPRFLAEVLHGSQGNGELHDNSAVFGGGHDGDHSMG